MATGHLRPLGPSRASASERVRVDRHPVTWYASPMINGLRIVDADAHVLEPPDLFEHWLTPELRSEAPVHQADGRWFWRGAPVQHKLPEVVRLQAQAASGTSPTQLLAAMDRTGVDVAHLYPRSGLYLWHVKGMHPGFSAALTRAYNDWLADFCDAAPDRLRGVASISLADPELAEAEARRATKTLQTTLVHVRPNPVGALTLASSPYEPLWEFCEEAGVAVSFHEGSQVRATTVGQERFQTEFALGAASHPMEMMLAFLSLLEGGVFERHPRLRVGFLDAGCGWVPYWLHRLDERWARLGFEVEATVSMAPSAYFRRQCWVTVDPYEPGVNDLVERVGADRLLYGGTNPGPDGEPDVAGAVATLVARLGPDAARAILTANASAFAGNRG
jgi:uncharacterized protein